MAPTVKPPAAVPVTPLDPARIAAIAATLDDEPAGPGDPVGERRRWDELAALPAFQSVASETLATLDEPLPVLTDEIFLDYSRSGKQTAYRDFEQSSRPGFANLVLAECIDNRGRLLERIHAAADAILSERTWVHSFHDPKLDNWNGRIVEIDLRVATISWMLSTACHLLGDRLDAATQERVQAELAWRTFTPFRGMLEGSKVHLNQENAFSWLELLHNWNATCLGGVACSALTLIESKEERAHYVAAAERYAQNFIAGFPADGSCSEGVGYWGGGFTHFAMLAEHVWQATHGAVDLLADEHVRLVAQYGARMEIMPGVFPAFADCRPNPTVPADLMGFVSRRYGLGLRSWEETASERSGINYVVIYAFPNSATRRADGGAEMAPAAPRELRSWFDDAGLFVGRPARESGGLGVSFKGGHNGEFHNHNDIGSFVAAVNGKVLIIDPGMEHYTARTFSRRRYQSNLLNSFGHSVPVVAGILQGEGSGARAAVLRTSFSDDEDLVAYDLSQAYDAEELEQLERAFIFSREGRGRLTVRDVVRFRSAQTFATALITTAELRHVDCNRLVLTDGKESLGVGIRVEGGEVEISSEIIEEEAYTSSPPIRLGINLKEPVHSAVIELVIEPRLDLA